jgi:hypothetical protein
MQSNAKKNVFENVYLTGQQVQSTSTQNTEAEASEREAGQQFLRDLDNTENKQ